MTSEEHGGIKRILRCIFCEQIIEEIDAQNFPMGIAVIHEVCRGRYDRDIENEIIRSIVLE